ncbi:hypothetical protein CTI14_19170 [Methylobacterium radiotolerans]|nr:hypothetical protein CTI14_19170 [Methylobacterium radiotolerans]
MYGDPLRVGDKVVFTGFVGAGPTACTTRGSLSGAGCASSWLGIGIDGDAGHRRVVLPAENSSSAHELGTRIVAPETYAALLKHLQPALTAAPKVAPKAPAAQRNDPGVAAGSPAEIRAWGIANGYAVGVRGRLSAELKAAYEEATSLTGV